MKAVCLLSGGLDSATAFACALEEIDDAVYPISFDYGQRHIKELESAELVAEWGVANARGVKVDRLRVISIKGLKLPTSALTSKDVDVPTNRDEATMAKDIPVTYVPARNSIFLSVAAAIAEAYDCSAIYTGFNAVDYSGYPDCRPDFVAAMQRALILGTNHEMQIRAPLINMTKVEIVRLAIRKSVPITNTWSCYKGLDVPCNECDSCIIRNKAIAEVRGG